jgi:hypothetical protein
MSITTLGWLFTLGVLAHNAEESVSLPSWAAMHAPARWRVVVEPVVFRWAAACQSLILVALAAWALSAAPRSVAWYGFTGYVFAMMVNAIAPHLLATVALRRYMPGTATALLFNLPLGLLLLRQALAEGLVAWRTLAWAAPAVSLLVLGSIPVLFALGGRLRAIRP